MQSQTVNDDEYLNDLGKLINIGIEVGNRIRGTKLPEDNSKIYFALSLIPRIQFESSGQAISDAS